MLRAVAVVGYAGSCDVAVIFCDNGDLKIYDVNNNDDIL